MSIDEKLNAYFGAKVVHCEIFQMYVIYVQEWPSGEFSARVIEPGEEYRTHIDYCKTLDEALEKARIRVKREVLDAVMSVSENDSAHELWRAE